MAENTFVCKHMVGAGWCKVYENYCVDGPCGYSEPIEYAPVVHGRWKCTAIGRWACSACSCEPYYFRNVHALKYCPNCGAKMDGEP